MRACARGVAHTHYYYYYYTTHILRILDGYKSSINCKKSSRKMDREFGFWTICAKPSRICYLFIFLKNIYIFYNIYIYIYIFLSSGHSFDILPVISTENQLRFYRKSIGELGFFGSSWVQQVIGLLRVPPKINGRSGHWVHILGVKKSFTNQT